MKNKFFFNARKKHFLKTFFFLFSVGFCIQGNKGKDSGEKGVGSTKKLANVRIRVSCLDSQNNEIENFQVTEDYTVKENCVKMKFSFFGELEEAEIGIIRNKIEELLKKQTKLKHVMFDLSTLNTIEMVNEIKEIFFAVPKNIKLRIKLVEEIFPLEYVITLMGTQVFRFEKIKVFTKKRFENLEKISGLIEKSRVEAKEENTQNNNGKRKSKTKMTLVREGSEGKSELKIVVEERLTPKQLKQNRDRDISRDREIISPFGDFGFFAEQTQRPQQTQDSQKDFYIQRANYLIKNKLIPQSKQTSFLNFFEKYKKYLKNPNGATDNGTQSEINVFKGLCDFPWNLHTALAPQLVDPSDPKSKRIELSVSNQKEYIDLALKAVMKNFYGEKIEEAALLLISAAVNTHIDLMVHKKMPRKKNAFLFVGPPGTGKTALAACVAEVLGLNFQLVPLGGLDDQKRIRGIEPYLVGAGPGIIASSINNLGPTRMKEFDAITEKKLKIYEKGIFQEKFSNGTSFMMLAFDEFEKAPQAIQDACLLLEDSEQIYFEDSFLGPIDKRLIISVYTANEKKISPPMESRLRVIEFQPYRLEEKIEIAKKIWEKNFFDPENSVYKERFVFDDPYFFDFFVKKYFKNTDGVREISSKLLQLFYSLREKADNGENVDKKIMVTKDDLEIYLGPPTQVLTVVENQKPGESSSAYYVSHTTNDQKQNELTTLEILKIYTSESQNKENNIVSDQYNLQSVDRAALQIFNCVLRKTNGTMYKRQQMFNGQASFFKFEIFPTKGVITKQENSALALQLLINAESFRLNKIIAPTDFVLGAIHINGEIESIDSSVDRIIERITKIINNSDFVAGTKFRFLVARIDPKTQIKLQKRFGETVEIIGVNSLQEILEKMFPANIT